MIEMTNKVPTTTVDNTDNTRLVKFTLIRQIQQVYNVK